MSMSFSYPTSPSLKPVLVHGLRTPFVKAGTALKTATAADLGVFVVQELLARAELPVEDIDELIFGCVGQASGEANVARVIALRAGLPISTPAYSVHRNCASGMQSIEDAARRIAAGEGEIYVVGGTESMSSYPLLFGKKMTELFARLAGSKTLMARMRTLASFRPSFLKPRISLLEGLTDPTCGLIMGKTAEKLALQFGISREEQDAFALESHQKAERAWAENAYDEEVMTVFGAPKGKATRKDNGPREGQSMAALAKLRPFFDRSEGTVTVGNSCPVTDGAVALIMMSEEQAKARGMTIMGRLVSSSVAGLDPSRMGLGPVYAAPAAIEMAGMTGKDMDLWEVNEAFAAQVLACQRALDSQEFCQKELGLSSAFGAPDPAILNPRGGAVALGHPVGATGARLVLCLLRQLQERGGGKGVATLCVGGGQGAAQVWEAA